MSLDPSERANEPFMVMPTPAKASAAADNSIAEILRRGRAAGLIACVVARGSGVTVASVNPRSTDENSGGIRVAEAEDSSSAGATGLGACRLRRREVFERAALVLAFFFGGA
jgi:hypothetical protein